MKNFFLAFGSTLSSVPSSRAPAITERVPGITSRRSRSRSIRLPGENRNTEHLSEDRLAFLIERVRAERLHSRGILLKIDPNPSERSETTREETDTSFEILGEEVVIGHGHERSTVGLNRSSTA